MAVSREQWLRWAGRDQAWYDQLTPAERKQVDASVRNTSPDRTRQSLSLSTPGSIAQGIDDARARGIVEEQQRGRTDTERQQTRAAQDEQAIAWLTRYGATYDRGWYSSLPEDAKIHIIRASTETGFYSDAFYWNRGLTAVRRAEDIQAQAPAPGATPEPAPTTAGKPVVPPAGTAQPDPDDRLAEEAQLLLVPRLAEISTFPTRRIRPGAPFPVSPDVLGRPENRQIAAQFINELTTTWTTEQVTELQEKLVAARIMDRGDFNEGVPGQGTLSAVASAITEAAALGQDLERYLDTQVAAAQVSERKEKAAALKSIGESQYQQQLIALHVSLWGVPPTESWITRAIGGAYGDNIFEVEHFERHKPAFLDSPKGQQERLSIEQAAAETFGSLGGSFSFRGF